MTEDFGRFRFNTAVAKLMTLTNELQRVFESDSREAAADGRFAAEALVLMLAPMAPHVTEELWRSALGHGESVHAARWASFDPSLAAAEEVVLVVQVDGKVRDRLTVPADLDPGAGRELALSAPNVRRFLEGRQVRRVFEGAVRPGAPRLVNIVTSV